MGLFSHTHHDDQSPEAEAAHAIAHQTFDENFQEELRQAGRRHFKKLLDDGTADLRPNIDRILQHISTDLKDYMRRQLDMTVARINTEITNQLSDRLKQFDAVAAESRDAMTQSLNHDTQDMREKYQQLSASLQQVVAQQEVLMASIFQDQKSRMESVQREQDEVLRSLTAAAGSARQQAEHLEQDLRHTIEQQKTSLDGIYQENLTRVQEVSAAQTETLNQLTASAAALEQKHQEMAQFLDKTVADQKAMMAQTVGDNMARIIEHYIIGALGEQSELRSQLPGIMQQMEQHKKEMMDDIAL